MSDKNVHSSQDTVSGAKHAASRWKTSCAAGQNPATGAPIRRAAYGQTPQQAAERLADSRDKNRPKSKMRSEGFKCP